MVKVENIRKIKDDLDRYKKLLGKETDFIKILKYRRLIRECEYSIMDVKARVLNISESENRSIFIDRYIKKIPCDLLAEKYNLSQATIYRKLNIAINEYKDYR